MMNTRDVSLPTKTVCNFLKPNTSSGTVIDDSLLVMRLNFLYLTLQIMLVYQQRDGILYQNIYGTDFVYFFIAD